MRNRFYLSIYRGAEHAMGHMIICLSDTTFTREDSPYFRRMLREGDVVLCECESRQVGVYTVGIAKVEEFQADGKTPKLIRNLWGKRIWLMGNDEIFDHRQGHAQECPCQSA